VTLFPKKPLEPNSTYEVSVLAGTVPDWSGNPNPTTFVARIATGATLNGTPLTLRYENRDQRFLVRPHKGRLASHITKSQWEWKDGQALVSADLLGRKLHGGIGARTKGALIPSK
jgi:hypothetical protein